MTMERQIYVLGLAPSGILLDSEFIAHSEAVANAFNENRNIILPVEN